MNVTEKILYIVLFAVLTGGLYFGATDPDFFTYKYVEEDGLIENATALFLFAGSIIMIRRLILLKSRPGIPFVIVSLLIIFAFLFVAGEEISWGQRIFNVESSEFFAEYNTQGETNLHNLTINEVKINKLIFGKILTVTLILYMVVVAIAYRKSEFVSRWCDQMGIPIPRYHHTIAYIIMALMVTAIGESRDSELLEFGSGLIFLLILMFPFNKHIYTLSHYEHRESTPAF